MTGQPLEGERRGFEPCPRFGGAARRQCGLSQSFRLRSHDIRDNDSCCESVLAISAIVGVGRYVWASCRGRKEKAKYRDLVLQLGISVVIQSPFGQGLLGEILKGITPQSVGDGYARVAKQVDAPVSETGVSEEA